MLTLEDLGVLRGVERRDGRIVVKLTPTYTGCPATPAIELGGRGGAGRGRHCGRTGGTRAVAAVVDRRHHRGGAAQAEGVWHRPAALAGRGARTLFAQEISGVPAVRLHGDRQTLRVRLDRVQGAVALRGVRASRSTISSASDRAMHEFQPLEHCRGQARDAGCDLRHARGPRGAARPPSASSRASTCPCAPSSAARSSGAPIRSARAPDEARLRIAIKRVADGRFSNWANDTLKAGGTLEAMPPAGPLRAARRATAKRAMSWRLPRAPASRRSSPWSSMRWRTSRDTSFTLVYGNRTLESILFREELEDLKDRHLGRFTLLNVLSRNEESSAPLLQGRITGEKVKALAETLFKPDEIAHVFLCGPGSMIKETRDALLALGIRATRSITSSSRPAGRAPGSCVCTRRAAPLAGSSAEPVRPSGTGGRSPSSTAYATVHRAAGRTCGGRGTRGRHPRALFLQGRHVLHLPRQAGRGPGRDDDSTTASSPGRWSAGSSSPARPCRSPSGWWWTTTRCDA